MNVSTNISSVLFSCFVCLSVLQEMESEVNVHYEELVHPESRDQILSNQLQRICMCFDVYLETESKNMAREGPLEISREKIYPRLAR